MYMLYNVNLERSLGTEEAHDYSGLVYCWLDVVTDGDHKSPHGHNDTYFCSVNEKLLSIIVSFGVGAMVSAVMKTANDASEISKIVNFIQGSGERWEDIVVVPLLKIQYETENIGAALLDFSKAYPILDLVYEEEDW